MEFSPALTFLPPPTNPTADRHLQNPCLGIPHTITHPSTQIFPPHISIVLSCLWTNHHLTLDGRMLLGIHHSSIPKPTSTALFSSALGDPKTILHAGPPTYTDLPPHILSRELGTDVPLYGSTQVRPHTEISPHCLRRTNHHVTVTLSLFHSLSHSVRCIINSLQLFKQFKLPN